MAAMDPQKLSSMCSSINNAASNYVSQVETSVSEMTNVFNDNWVSNASRDLAKEITDCLNSLATSIKDTFDSKNEAVKISVNNTNSVEGEQIAYPGFAFSIPRTDITLNATLPNGKIGVADNADLNVVSESMKRMIEKISTILDEISNTVSNADAFDIEEQSSLSSSITNIKSRFENEMQELHSSLVTRMTNEINQREQLDSTNKSNLEA